MYDTSGQITPVLDVNATLRLIIADSNIELTLPQQAQFIMGRPERDGDIDVDLSLYGAYRLGVSRNHARIDLAPYGITVTDLDSSYGTRCNGYPLPAGVSHHLHDGDTLMLGNLRLIVAIQH